MCRPSNTCVAHGETRCVPWAWIAAMFIAMNLCRLPAVRRMAPTQAERSQVHLPLACR